jgi:hypothetical protein
MRTGPAATHPVDGARQAPPVSGSPTVPAQLPSAPPGLGTRPAAARSVPQDGRAAHGRSVVVVVTVVVVTVVVVLLVVLVVVVVVVVRRRRRAVVRRRRAVVHRRAVLRRRRRGVVAAAALVVGVRVVGRVPLLVVLRVVVGPRRVAGQVLTSAEHATQDCARSRQRTPEELARTGPLIEIRQLAEARQADRRLGRGERGPCRDTGPRECHGADDTHAPDDSGNHG